MDIWNRLPKPLRILISLVFISAFTGVIGNRSDWAFLKGISSLRKVISQIGGVEVPVWMLALFLVFTFLLAWTTFHYFGSHRAAIKLVKLDDTLLRLLSSFKLNPNTSQATTLLFQEFFQDTLELFSDGCRISILLPDPNDPDYLKIFYSLGVPQETISRTKFYIGSNDGERGIAGWVYLEKKLRVVHLLWTDNQWKPDDSAYKVFIPRKTQRSMPYQAIAAVGLIRICS